MPKFMSAVARKDVEEAMDAQPQRLEGKYAELAELAEDGEKLSFGELFWEFILDDLFDEDEV
jgi:hypothetical protein